MNNALGQTLADHLLLIRDHWTARLRDEPPHSALGRRNTVEFLVEATLTQLATGLVEDAQRHWLDHCSPVAGMVHGHCACALPPVQRYFSAGERAIRAALATMTASDVEAIVSRLRELAGHEERSLCQPCQRRGSSVCIRNSAAGAAPDQPA